MAYFKFVLSQSESGSPSIKMKGKNELRWFDTPSTSKKYYVAKLVSGPNEEEIVVSDYGVPVNRLDSHIGETGGHIVINRTPGEYSSGSSEEIAPREYTETESQRAYSWKSTEFDTFPIVNFGDLIKISFEPQGNVNGDFGYYDTNGSFTSIGTYTNGQLVTGKNYYIPSGQEEREGHYFIVDRQLMEEQNARLNNQASKAGHVTFLKHCVHVEFSFGVKTMCCRIKDTQGNVYRDWERISVQYISVGTQHIIWNPKNCDFSNIPDGYTVEIYGTTERGYVFSGGDLDGHTTPETALTFVYNGYTVLNASVARL